MAAGGKGSKQRKSQVPQEQVKSNWDLIFGKKDSKQSDKPVDTKTDTK